MNLIKVMTIVAISLNLTFDIRAMSTEDQGLLARDFKKVSMVDIDDDPDIDNDAVFAAEKKRYEAYRAKIGGFYKAIQDADQERVQALIEDDKILEDNRYWKSELFRQKVKPDKSAFECAFAENDDTLFQRRCQIFNLIVRELYSLNRHSSLMILLERAVVHNHYGMVVFLIENVLDLNKTFDYRGRSALFFANTEEMVELLINRGIDVEKRCRGETTGVRPTAYEKESDVPERIRQAIIKRIPKKK